MIRVGVGGWTFEPWRGGAFYPPGLAQAKELQFASRALSAIEINGTYYSTQKPASFRKWHDETPDDFIFAVKGNRFCTNRRDLAGAGESIERFLTSGLEELGPKLGPILWQLAPTKKFDAADLEGFLALLPKKLGKLPLRHALEARHESFQTPDFIALARKHGVGVVLADSDKYPLIADVTADFVYLRVMRASEAQAEGLSAADQKKWVERAQAWEKGDAPKDMTLISPAMKAAPRDVFLFMISGDKVKAPAAAQALLRRL
ncbi:MAG: DUF72 domain-containing protein [Hyphomonadaceae bacterium]